MCIYIIASNICTAECQTFNLQVLDITNSLIMNPEVLEEIDADNRIINSPIMNPEVLEEIDAYNGGTTSPTIIQNNQYTEDNLIVQFNQTDGRIYVTNECQTGDQDYNHLPNSLTKLVIMILPNSLTTSLTGDHDYNYLPNSLTTSLTGDHDYNYLPNSLTTSLTGDHDYNYLPNSLTTSLIDQNETHVLSNENENHVMHSNENETHLSIYEHEVINLTTNSTNYQEIQILFF
ncbi:unnamed protein product [Gordionus sp. m RMFG-2023]